MTNSKDSTQTNGQPSSDLTESPALEMADPVERARALLSGRIASYRLTKGMSMAALAAEAGITSAMASQIERGVTNPSIATLVRIAGALDVSVADLFEVDHPEGMVVRVGDRKMIDYPELDVSDEIISSDPSKRIQVLESRIGPRASSGEEFVSHGADIEFVFVLEGTIDVIADANSYRLKKGDTLTLQGPLPHRVSNPTDETVRLIWVMTPPIH